MDTRYASKVLLFLDVLESGFRDEVLLVESRRHLDVRRGGELLCDATTGTKINDQDEDNYNMPLAAYRLSQEEHCPRESSRLRMARIMKCEHILEV